MSTISLHPTPVLSDAKTSPPLSKGRGLRGASAAGGETSAAGGFPSAGNWQTRRGFPPQATGVWGQSTWNKGLNVIVDTNGKMPIPQEHKIHPANMQRQIFLRFI
ncbi:hypothetical protein [Scytonema sp. PRP1]|uniref:hypothetical protein n=1 Tax=Scytonema sp. PRP1 TaxID=3120513 RepID=UPI002FCF9956